MEYIIEEFVDRFYPKVKKHKGEGYQYIDDEDPSEDAPSKAYARVFNTIGAAEEYCNWHNENQPVYHEVKLEDK